MSLFVFLFEINQNENSSLYYLEIKEEHDLSTKSLQKKKKKNSPAKDFVTKIVFLVTNLLTFIINYKLRH